MMVVSSRYWDSEIVLVSFLHWDSGHNFWTKYLFNPKFVLMLNCWFMKYLNSEAGLPIQILAWETGPPHRGVGGPKGGGTRVRWGGDWYKPLIKSYIWGNQQHNGPNWSPKPLNMALSEVYFAIIKELRTKRAENFWSGRGTWLSMGGGSPFMRYIPPAPILGNPIGVC